MNAISDVVLAKQEPPTKPTVTVLIGHRSCMGDSLELLTKFELGERFDLRFFRFGDDVGFWSEHETELVKLTKSQPFEPCPRLLAGGRAGVIPSAQGSVWQANHRGERVGWG